MAWYASRDNCINRPPVPAAWRERIVNGWDNLAREIGTCLVDDVNRLHRPCFLALDGYKGAQLNRLVDGLTTFLASVGVSVLPFNVNKAFRSKEDIDRILREYEKPEDPSFGRVFTGALEDLIDLEKVREITARWGRIRGTEGEWQVVICHGVGAGMAIWRHWFDRVVYCDVTREQILRRAERNELLPVGEDTPHGFPWKRIYNAEYPMLNGHKKSLLKIADWYIDSASDENPKLVPADLYNALITELSGRPLSFKVFYMPGSSAAMNSANDSRSMAFRIPAGISRSAWETTIF